MLKKLGLTVLLGTMSLTGIGNPDPILSSEAEEVINEVYFDVSIDPKEKSATIDGEEVALTELFSISDKELEELLLQDGLEEFIEDNFMGEIEYDGDSIMISNPYSTKSLVIQTENASVFNSYDEITSVNQVAEDIYVVQYDSAAETKDGYELLAVDADIESVLHDMKVYVTEDIADTKNASDRNTAWGVYTTGLDHYRTKLSYTDDPDEITVAVLDTGININHEVFAEKEKADRISLTYSYDYVNLDNDASDDNGHGTAMAGVIAESTPYNVKIVPIKVMDSDGSGNLTDILTAVDELCERVDIINMSLGIAAANVSEETAQLFEAFFDAIREETGVIIVCAAGNNAASVAYPGACSSVLTASAVDINNEFAYTFSNYGDAVDFALPGVEVRVPYYVRDIAYMTSSGTSISCPFLTSAVANVMMEYGYTEYDDIMTVLKANAIDLGEEGKDPYYGYGSLDFRSSMFQKPVIIQLKSDEEIWAKEQKIYVTAVSEKNLVSYAITNTSEEPTQWNDLENGGTVLEETFLTTYDGDNYVWLKDEIGGTVYKKVSIQYIDVQAPTVIALEYENVTHNAVSLNLTAQDQQSGIKKITWYYKNVQENQYTEYGEPFETEDQRTEELHVTKEFTDLNRNTEYQFYAKVEDMLGNVIVSDTVSVKTDMKNPFNDVLNDAYYYDAVLWAVDKGITAGTTETTFSPKDDCTRAQVVMFLWREAGSPEPESAENPFSDVSIESRFYKAILWAYENGITTGYGDHTFRPNDTVRRGEYVTFQYRAAGSPALEEEDNPFEDVSIEKYPNFYKAILWAYKTGITTGKDDTHFLPNENCSRSNVVAFLYREKVK